MTDKARHEPLRAIITFDPERVAHWDMQAEAHSIAYAVRSALTGKGFVATRGLMRVDVLAAGQSVYIGPSSGIDGEMTVS